ncbi:hypothetical protein HBZS_117580 [Helicobacter bizzozeronii CCUG 35545]|nr:hypothetical protein HBZS_117580 [Helicobacter bizzozeronii CCUG 35545]
MHGGGVFGCFHGVILAHKEAFFCYTATFKGMACKLMA